MKRTGPVITAICLFTVLFTGCASTPESARGELERRADELDDATQDILQALESAGTQAASAAGHINYCGGSMLPGMAYTTSAHATVSGDLSEAMRAVIDELTTLGWNHVGEIGTDDLSARFTRDDITIDVKAGGATIGGKRYGEDEIEAGTTQPDNCVRVPDGTYADEFADLEKEILPRE
ncbi:hypothetical protein [Microbacterium sp.]|uniref:hypothetical protein n=1 Tax=Microbacterium sp. TaxID=51671 RepID=UPI0039E555BB